MSPEQPRRSQQDSEPSPESSIAPPIRGAAPGSARMLDSILSGAAFPDFNFRQRQGAASSPAFINPSGVEFEPKSSEFVMELISGLNQHLLLRGPAILRSIKFLNRLPGMRGFMSIEKIDFPEDDVARLQKYVSKDSAAFLAPNHPEIMSDWLLDKEVARRGAPRVAFWAADDVVNMNPVMRELWLRINLIPNGAGEPGKRYSVDWARKGNGVLIHPEGAVHWTGDMIGELFPGIVDMAMRTKRELDDAGDPRPVHVLPIVYRYNFTRDVSKELAGEIGYLEKSLDLPDGAGFGLGLRFFNLQKNILLSRVADLGFRIGVPVTAENFFRVQSAFREHILGTLEARYGIGRGDEWLRVKDIRRALKEAEHAEKAAGADKDKLAQIASDKKLVGEAVRLEEFNHYVYGGEKLSQEQISESIKRLRITYLRGKLQDQIHVYCPAASEGRVAHIRVCEPLTLDWRGHESVPYETKSFRESLISTLWSQLQTGVNEVRLQTDHERERFAIDNPFAPVRKK